MSRAGEGAHPPPGSSSGPKLGAAPTARAFVESAGVAFAAVAAGWLIDPRDPLLTHHPFPWLLLAPIVLALRHGFAAGALCASIMGAALVAVWRLHAPGASAFPGEALLGLVVVTTIAGQFSDLRRRETAQLVSEIDGLRRRVGEFARAHLLLELSHDRLEQQSVGAPNLRQALSRVDGLIASGGGSWEPLVGPMMAIFATYGMLEAGAMLAIDPAGRPGKVLGTLGRVEPIDPADPLLDHALRTGELTWIASSAVAGQPAVERSRILAVIPVTDSSDRRHAVLCVQSMPFVAFQKRNLETLAVLAGHFADRVAFAGRGFDPAAERRADFEAQLSRAVHDRRVLGVPSVVAALRMKDGGAALGIADLIAAGSLRPRDATCRERDRSGDSVLWMLLPMADETAAHALRRRIEAIVDRELNRALGPAGADFAYHIPDRTETAQSVMNRVSQTLDAPGE